MVKLNKIYTRSGDKGSTGLGDGSRVDKDHSRIEAYGTVDELNSVLGIVTCHLKDQDSAMKTLLSGIQNTLFDIGSDLCVPHPENEQHDKGHRLPQMRIEKLEKEIDLVNENLQALDSFVLPGGTVTASYLHLARTVCRRAERRIHTLSREETINENVLKYINRLSDLLFVLSRAANENGKTDIKWEPGK